MKKAYTFFAACLPFGSTRLVVWLAALATVPGALVSCEKLAGEQVVSPIAGASFSESFNHWDSTLDRGWVTINNSVPLGSGQWGPESGTGSWFPAYSGNGFASVGINSTSASRGLVSNWLVSPAVPIKNGDKIVFYTRCLLVDQGNGDSLDFGNSLELCINWFNDSTVVGTATDPRSGGYTERLDHGYFYPVLKINAPLYNPFSNRFEYRLAHSNTNLNDPLAYPTQWTRFEYTISSLNRSLAGRFAFRYYVPDAGPLNNGSGIGLDHVQFISNPD